MWTGRVSGCQETAALGTAHSVIEVFFLSSFWHPAEFRLGELCATSCTQESKRPGTASVLIRSSIRHCWSLSHTQRSLQMGAAVPSCCFKHCKRWLTPTQELPAITEPWIHFAKMLQEPEEEPMKVKQQQSDQNSPWVLGCWLFLLDC